MKCAICNKEYEVITASHIKFKHELGVAEYIALYGDVMSPERRLQQNQRLRDNHWSKKPLEETKLIRENQSRIGKQVMTKLNEQGRAFKYDSNTAKALWTDDHRKHIKSSLTGRKRTNQTKENIKASHWTKKSKDEVDSIIQRIFLKDSQLKDTEKGWFTSIKSGHEMFYMSSYEYKRLSRLETHSDVEWFTTAHGIKIKYSLDGNEHFYIPDIHIRWKDGSVTLEEIKGYIREPAKHAAKVQAADSFCKENNMKYSVIFEEGLNL